MSAPHPRRLFRLTWLCLTLGLAGPACAQPGEERLLNDAEIAGLERENALWRRVRPEDDVAANLARMRQAGASENEIARLELRLAAMWQVTFERNFGWLHEDTVAKIKEIDREFITKVRATRLHEITGIQAGGRVPLSYHSLERSWRSAILRALEYDEVAEFRLMNSASARDEARRVEGLPLTPDEVRTLFVWRREFDGKQVPALPEAKLTSVQQEERLDQWHRQRFLLGDERFALYLGREHAAFERMRTALARAGVPDATAALELWWLREKEGYARNQEPRLAIRDGLTTAIRGKAAKLIGETRLAEYSQDPDARWLVIPKRPEPPPRRRDPAVSAPPAVLPDPAGR